jgi:hypothetical protein
MMKCQSPAADRNKEPIWQVLKTKVLQGCRQIIKNNSPENKISFGDVSKHSDESPGDAVKVLETAAGHGIHTQYFTTRWMEELGTTPSVGSNNGGGDAGHSCAFEWFPTDSDPNALASIQAYMEETPLAVQQCVRAPFLLSFTDENEDGYTICEDPPSIPFNRSRSSPTSTSRIRLDDSEFDVIININMIHITPWSCTLGLLRTSQTKLRKGGTLLLYGPYRVGGTYVESNRYVVLFCSERLLGWSIYFWLLLFLWSASSFIMKLWISLSYSLFSQLFLVSP